MDILKFGGTSVGSAENIKKVAKIVTSDNNQKIVVLSAVSGTTNKLEQLASLYFNANLKEVEIKIADLKNEYAVLIDNLYQLKETKQRASQIANNVFTVLGSFNPADFSENEERIILAQGEIISTNLFNLYLKEQGVDCELISAFDFMKIDASGEPDTAFIEHHLNKIITQLDSNKIVITQGYICLNTENKIDNLKRGGSDYTASLIGAAVNASEIQIWTDIDGMHNNDPRFVENTFSVDEISFDEAAELAYFGAKILHPQSVIPAKEKGIPVLLKNTFNPQSKGTVIKNCASSNGVRAIAAKDGITAIKIKSYRMLMAYGFLRAVFEVFEKNKTSIDMITTSEVAVSLTIDDATNLTEILQELKQYGKVEVDSDLSIICVAGDFSQEQKGINSKVFNSLKDVPVRMVSYGGSSYNISLLVNTSSKVEALNALNKGLFELQAV